MGIGRRRILRAALVASIASGAPSSTWALLRRRNPLTEGLRATRAIGTLVPPGSPGLVRGVIAHEAISLAVGGVLDVVLPQRRSIARGATAGLAIGWVNLVVIAPRRYPAIAELALGPQLADNAAFGAIFAAIARTEGVMSGAPRRVNRGGRSRTRRRAAASARGRSAGRSSTAS